MACMDDLAEDTLHYEIMPFLTYEERINFNQSLRPIHRQSKKIKTDKLTEHLRTLFINQYLIKMNYIDKLRCDIEFNINNNINILSEKRNTKILDLLNFILININCLKKINFDKIIKSKCKEYMNPLSFDYVISSKEDKEKLINISTQIYNLLNI
jgi:hypothetical protein